MFLQLSMCLKAVPGALLSLYMLVSVCLYVYVCVCYVADYKRGFGGRYGVEVERQDQCALGYEHKESLAKHESQKGTGTSLNTPPNATFISDTSSLPTLSQENDSF